MADTDGGAPAKTSMFGAFDTQPIIAIVIILAFIVLVLIWMLHTPSGDASQLALLNALIMVVGTAFMTIVNYYFSSSKGSTGKDSTIAALASGNGAPAVPATPVVPATAAAPPAGG
jgi:hypothetical protein